MTASLAPAITRREMRAQVAAFLTSIEAGRYDLDGAFFALVARFGVRSVARLEGRAEFWAIVDQHDRRP